jgi:hypothetical protein
VLDELLRWRDRLHWARQGIDVIRAMEERIENASGNAILQPLYFMLAQEHEAQGNYAAAEAIRLQDPVNEIYRWHEDVERTSVGVEAIHVLQERIDSEPDAARRRGLKFILAQEYYQVRRDFLDRLPPGSIDPEVARQYDEHYREADPIHRRALGFGS